MEAAVKLLEKEGKREQFMSFSFEIPSYMTYINDSSSPQLPKDKCTKGYLEFDPFYIIARQVDFSLNGMNSSFHTSFSFLGSRKK